jgi:hypothetical protein
MSEHWPKSVEEVTQRYYCDTCKEGTQHRQTSPGVWRCTIPHPGNDGRHPNEPSRQTEFENPEFATDARHWAALDGMGNRGEPPPPRTLRQSKGEPK